MATETALNDAIADNVRDLTQHEIHALTMKYNVADAHAHQSQSAAQRNIVNRLPELWYDAENRTQAEIEQQFLDAFFDLHGQPTARLKNKTMLSYAASIATVVAAMYLRRERMSVTLIEPCFDNLHDVLANMGVPLHPIDESAFFDPHAIYDNLRERMTTEALFLVDPNNPTGSSLLRHGSEGFAEVIRFCRDHSKLLVVDFCFAAFALHGGGPRRFDIYEMLETSGISYLAIEDTGKTWPVQDAKCAMLTPSDDILSTVYDLHTSVLLNVSPFVLNMLTHYITASIDDQMHSVRSLLVRNRDIARATVEGTALTYLEPTCDVSVAWFRIDHPTLTASELQRRCEREEVYVLPGNFFVWSQPSRGEQYVRVALARDEKLFATAMRKLRAVLDAVATDER